MAFLTPMGYSTPKERVLQSAVDEARALGRLLVHHQLPGDGLGAVLQCGLERPCLLQHAFGAGPQSDRQRAETRRLLEGADVYHAVGESPPTFGQAILHVVKRYFPLELLAPCRPWHSACGRLVL